MPDKVLKITRMKTYKNYLDNFKRLAEYTIHKSDGNTVEMNVDNADTKGWKFIGEIVYGGPDWHKNDRKYILCYPNYTTSTAICQYFFQIFLHGAVCFF